MCNNRLTYSDFFKKGKFDSISCIDGQISLIHFRLPGKVSFIAFRSRLRFGFSFCSSEISFSIPKLCSSMSAFTGRSEPPDVEGVGVLFRGGKFSFSLDWSLTRFSAGLLIFFSFCRSCSFQEPYTII